jgi:orotidine-5'-phosphate decarboxylase
MSPVTSHQSPELIVALDVDTLEKAKKLVERLCPTVKLFKIGSQLFTACGPKAVEMVAKRGGQIFLDLKFHDIPNTVKSAAAIATSLNSQAIGKDSPVFMVTVHTVGGKQMLEAAVRGARDKAEELKIKRPFVVGITVLTSDAPGANTAEMVLERAGWAKDAGLDGVVCSVLEAAAVRKAFGKDFIIVTPGIRPKGANAQDQKRVATATDAINAGATFIVVGRPILEAPDPLVIAKNLLSEL